MVSCGCYGCRHFLFPHLQQQLLSPLRQSPSHQPNYQTHTTTINIIVATVAIIAAIVTTVTIITDISIIIIIAININTIIPIIDILSPSWSRVTFTSITSTISGRVVVGGWWVVGGVDRNTEFKRRLQLWAMAVSMNWCSGRQGSSWKHNGGI